MTWWQPDKVPTGRLPMAVPKMKELLQKAHDLGAAAMEERYCSSDPSRAPEIYRELKEKISDLGYSQRDVGDISGGLEL